MKTPISYYGGKQTMLKHMEPLIPAHKVYTESFAGGAALYWAKKPAELEVLNDLNGNLINFYRVLKCHFNELKEKIETTLHSREIFDFASIVYDYPQFFDPVTRAWALWVKSKMGFASMLDGTFGYDKTTNSMAKKIDNSKHEFTISLQKRIEKTQIECTNALHVIESRDCEDAFHFVDPPYINSDCGHYTDTFNLMNFEELLTLLATLKGKWMLTMYPHEVLREYIDKHDWKLVAVERTISVSTVNRRKQEEWIVMNYEAIQGGHYTLGL
jgi:DNA adenine methylase